MIKIGITSDTHRGYSQKTDAIFRHKFLPTLVAEKPDIIIHAGDWGMTKPENTISGFRLFREFFPDTPIVGVLGNHDYWGQLFRRVQATEDMVREAADESKIVLLSGGLFSFRGINIFGFDGWYAETNPPTNDGRWIPKWADAAIYLKSKASSELHTILDAKGPKDIVVTHFPPFTEDIRYGGFCAPSPWHTLLASQFKHLIVGHSHLDNDFMTGDCRVLNAGSDYDKPKYKMLEV